MSLNVYSGIGSLPSGNMHVPVREGCLVLEGGAFRGLYGEGVLDAMMEAGIRLSCVIGVSAGALNGMNYVSGQIGRSARMNLIWRHDSRYIGWKALRMSGSPIRVRFLLEDCNQLEDPLDEAWFYRPDQRFLAVATDCETGQPVYFEKGVCSDMMAAVQASASMPFISPPVLVDGRHCLDGGCSVKIPFAWAQENGYRKIVIIKTREHGYRKKAIPEHRQKMIRRVYRRYPRLAEQLIRMNDTYNEELAAIERLQEAGKVFVIEPQQPVTVSRVERDVEKLGALYREGYRDGKAVLPALCAYLEQQPE